MTILRNPLKLLKNPLAPLLSKLPPMPSQPPTHQAHRSTLLQLSLLIGIAVALHFSIANTLIAGFAFIIFALKTVIVFKNLSSPPKLILMILTIASLGMVIYVYGGWSGQRAGISFLILLVALKFLESESLRDYYVVCLLLYFLSASSFLFDSSILNISLVVAYTIATTSILLQISNPAKLPLKSTLGMSASMVAKALPLAILLFFFFPRIQGSFGFLPSSDAGSSATSLSDSLVAGELASSAFNNELAFRVEFENGVTPSQEQLYWRVKTMPIESRFQWQVIKPSAHDFVRSLKKQDDPVTVKGEWEYTILHEQSTDRYLPYLDYLKNSERGIPLRDYSVYMPRLALDAFSYAGNSSADSFAEFAQPVDRQAFLQVSSRPNAKMQLLLNTWREGASSDAEMVNTVYDYFKSQPFEYTLTPRALDDLDPFNDFMFESQSGYCEHYASAFTIIMRSLGIPSRVVVGYQGGSRVNNGQFLEVRYSDAHAWSEVWVDGQWRRVDPTATISPERINLGMNALMELWDSGLLGSNDTGLALENLLNPTGASKWFKKIGDSWKTASYQWNKWIVNYDFNAQRQLLAKLGVDHHNSVTTLVSIMFLGAITLLLFYFWQLVPQAVKRDPLQVHYLKFIRKFKPHKVYKNPSETPKEFAQRLSSMFPSDADNIEQITNQYYQLRYSVTGGDSENDIKQFKNLIKRFKPKKTS